MSPIKAGAHHAALRHFYLVLGIVFLVLGIVGLFLPILPTTPFLLLTAYFFSKSSERLHQWLMNHRIFGKPLRDWQEDRVIGIRAKLIAIPSILVGMCTLWLKIPDHTPTLFYSKVAALLLMTSVSIFILLQKSKSPSKGV